MKRSQFSMEQVANALRQARSGTSVAEVCRQLGMSEATFYIEEKEYAHLGQWTTSRRWRSLLGQKPHSCPEQHLWISRRNVSW